MMLMMIIIMVVINLALAVLLDERACTVYASYRIDSFLTVAPSPLANTIDSASLSSLNSCQTHRHVK